MTLREISRVCGGAVHDGDPQLQVTGDAFLDSREPVPRGLFVAVAGERVDGHDFAAKAVAAGAVAVLGTRVTGAPTVVVGDIEEALARLATAVLARRRTMPAPLTVIALTGSQGKTTTKDLLAAVLAGSAATIATRGSANNELGLPLTVLRTSEATRFLVLEMGARGIGHIEALCRIAPPDVSAVLNVGSAHVGEFGSRENIALAKGELVEALSGNGLAVLNADDALVRAMSGRTPGRVATFGRDDDADLRLDAVRVDDLGRPEFDLLTTDARAHVKLRLLGEHQAINAAAAAAIAAGVGVDLGEVAARLGDVREISKWRMQLTERADGVVVVNDAYNANPESMGSALATLAEIGRRTGRRTVAVLGEMRELGAISAAEHEAIGRRAAELGIDVLLVVGEPARPVLDGYAGSGHAVHVGTADAARDWVRQNVSGPDVVLVKASRGDGLERVAAVPEQQADAGTANAGAKTEPTEEASR